MLLVWFQILLLLCIASTVKSEPAPTGFDRQDRDYRPLQVIFFFRFNSRQLLQINSGTKLFLIKYSGYSLNIFFQNFIKY